MTRWAPLKTDVLDALATEILRQYSRGRVIVAVDARDPELAAAFAGDLAAAISRTSHSAFAASLGDFRLPSDSDGSYDYSLLQRVLIDPFRLSVGTGFVLAGFDEGRNLPVEPRWSSGPKDAILVLAGEQLQIDALRGQWNYSIWLDDGSTDPKSPYVKKSKPATTATAIVDVSNPEHPRRVFADSC